MSQQPPWWQGPIPTPDAEAEAAAARRQADLAKPPGSLGALEGWATRLAGLQATTAPALTTIHISVFCGDHGVAAEGVSAYPAAVTATMARHFATGGAAIHVLARDLGADLEAVDVGMGEPAATDGVRDERVGAATANIRHGPAMARADCEAALAAGARAAGRAEAAGAHAFIGGEMGIANTTAATAVAARLLGVGPDALAGPGTGLDPAGVAHKIGVIEGALAQNGAARAPLDVLAALGGYEIAALTGAYIACAQRGIAVILDGYIAGVAALVAAREATGVVPWLIAGHRSAERGHDRVLTALGLEPVLDLGMALGEGSGAALAVPALRAACALHADMATLAPADTRLGEGLG